MTMPEVPKFDYDDRNLYVGPKLRVYLGVGMTHRDNSGLRAKIRDEASRIFKEHQIDVYNPCEVTQMSSPHKPKEVFWLNYLQLVQSDFAFFIRIQPAHGLGMEAQIAANALVPWSDVTRNDQYKSEIISPSITGLPNPLAGMRITFDPSNIAQFSEKLESQIACYKEKIGEVRTARVVARQVVVNAEIGTSIRRQRFLLNLQAKELGQATGLAPWWVEAIESNDDVGMCTTLIQLIRLVRETRQQFTRGLDSVASEVSFPTLSPIDGVSAKLLRSANEFTKYSLSPHLPGEPRREEDSHILSQWQQWRKERKCPEFPTRSKIMVQPVQELNVALSYPVSSLGQHETDRMKIVLDAIRLGLDRIKSVQIRVLEPEALIRTQRNEHGSTIHLNALARVNDSDLGIVVGFPASTGVGIGTQLFADATVPYISVSDVSVAFSRMLQGVFATRIGRRIEYNLQIDLPDTISRLISENLDDLRQCAAVRRSVRDKLMRSATKGLERIRIANGWTKDGMRRHLGGVRFIGSDWLCSLIDKPTIMPTMTLLQFVHIANEMDFRIDVDEEGIPAWYPTYIVAETGEQLRRREILNAADRSLDNLVRILPNTPKNDLFADNDWLYTSWQDYAMQLTNGSRRHEDNIPVRSENDWHRLLTRR